MTSYRPRVIARRAARAVLCLAILLAALAPLLVGCTVAQTSTDTQAPPSTPVATQPPASASGPSADHDSPTDTSGSEAAADPEPEVAADPEPDSPALEIRLRAATVARVVDGDTAHFRLTKTGEVEKVRFIGVDTPESTIEHEPYGAEASAYTKEHLKTGRKVYLELDAEKRDRYGRLLAYVWLSKPAEADGDGRPTLGEATKRMFNAQLMRDGYAQVLTIPPNVRYQDYFLELQRKARDAERGLWGLPAAAGSSSGAQAAPTGDTPYIGNRNTLKFHRARCASVNQMNPANKVPFTTRDKAIAAGYVPCKNCRP